MTLIKFASPLVPPRGQDICDSLSGRYLGYDFAVVGDDAIAVDTDDERLIDQIAAYVHQVFGETIADTVEQV